MQKYFITEQEFKENIITNDDAFHITKVMRNKKGDKVTIGYNNQTYLVELTNISEKKCEFQILEDITIDNELKVKVTIIQGYPKGDKFEDIIKHGVELGAYEFIPLNATRSQFKIEQKRLETKITRFNKIAKEAAEQSNRLYVPKVKTLLKLKDIDFSNYDHIFVCYEESAKNGELTAFKNLVTSLKENDKVCFIIGPEGGLTEEEVSYLVNKGAKVGALGRRILRTETVVFYLLSSISYEMELK